jgi:hypothetical protein
MNEKEVTEVKENELLANFQVEELEKRYEMGWISSGEVTLNSDGSGSITIRLDV